VTGSGFFDDDSGGLTLDVSFQGGSLEYTRSGDYELQVTGTFRGEDVDLAG
jgi:hypothetical protein